jgi:hypothetical protein
MQGRLVLYDSATEEICEALERDDFRVMWNPRTSQYEVQQYISEGWDSIQDVIGGRLTHLIYPCFFWSTVLTVKRWGPDVIREVHWGLTVPAETILAELHKKKAEKKRDNERTIDDGTREMAKWAWQGTPHKTIYSTPA